MTKIVFFGTPDYVVPILDTIYRAFRSTREKSPIAAVVTQPPKVVGRKKLLTYSPVDAWAFDKKIPKYFESAKIVEKGVEADLGILESYGEFISPKVINYFKHGIINAHPSLLPHWRGASPVQATILSGENETGVSVIKLDNQWDHGPIISQLKAEVLPDDTTGSLRNRLFESSAEFLVGLIPNYLNDKIKPKEQDHSKATLTTQIKKEDGFISPEYLEAALEGKTLEAEWKINWIKDYSINPSAEIIERFIRAMQPWPGAWTLIRPTEGQSQSRLKILKAHVTDKKLVLDKVQLEGKTEINWQEFKKGHPGAGF